MNLKITILFFGCLVMGVGSSEAQSDIRLYAFGHSLIDHRPPAIPTPGDETTILYWMHELTEAAGYDFRAGGQYGFLDTHANLPPEFNWWYEEVPGVWDDDTMTTFADADINTILLTAANFIQYEPVYGPYPLDESTTVLELTETIFDWVNEQEAGVNYYIYANWPEMDLPEAFPPTLPSQAKIDAFYTYTKGNFTDWWVEYQDSLLVARPALNVRLIPVGAIISKILTEVMTEAIPFDELYEDSSPHGRPTIYFLAGMITYMAIYGEQAPADYMPSDLVYERIRTNLGTIRDFIWAELNAFNLPNGDSRVFASPIMDISNKNLDSDVLQLFPNPSTGRILFSEDLDNYAVTITNICGDKLPNNAYLTADREMDISSLPNGLYFVRLWDQRGGVELVRRVVKVE